MVLEADSAVYGLCGHSIGLLIMKTVVVEVMDSFVWEE